MVAQKAELKALMMAEEWVWMTAGTKGEQLGKKMVGLKVYL